jgi:hypothetical protein
MVVARKAPLGPRYLTLADSLCASLIQGGVRPDLVLTTSYALSNYVLGATIAQISQGAVPGGIPDGGELVRRYPALAAAFDAGTPEWESAVEYGLDLLLQNVDSPDSTT